MKKTITHIAKIIGCVLISAASAHAQFSFVNANNRLNNTAVPNFHSGCTVAVSDMDGDGLDDIIRLSQGHDVYIEYQKTGNQFLSVHIADFGGSSEWGMCIADVDHNGYKDILAGGNSGSAIKLMKMNSAGLIGSIVSISTAAFPSFFLQNANFMDVNNDGWEDIFACNDNGPSVMWVNDGTGNFIVSNMINFNIHPWSIGSDPADAGNYGSLWSDFDNDGDVDLYIAKCRQGVSSSSDPRRVNVLYVNNGNGTFSQMDTTYGVADSLESWTSNFADIDNDGDLDLLITEQNSPSRILENNGSGYFTDITSSTGFVLTVQPIESILEDFDNDGFVDILVTGASSEIFHNNGNKTFSLVANPFDNNDMESFATGDLNHDGKIDVYGGYANIYTTPTSVNDVLWMNTTNNQNNFITLHLIGVVSNKGALGARAEIYGAWGKQIREVHAGESYGTCNTSDLHFGLGLATTIDSVVIRWPSGIITHIVNPAINQFITIIEGTCTSPDNVVTANGPLVICPGNSVTLTAAAGYNYLWSTGATTQSISVSTAGEYAVTISSAGNNCSSTSAISVLLVNPDQTPTVATSVPDLNFCVGGSITLTSSPATSYLWSNGETTQAIVVNQTGNYSVTIQGTCTPWTSSSVAINVYPANAPVASNVNIPNPGIATLTATGNDISWYNVATGGTPVGTGLTYITPFLNNDTDFYAEDAYSYNGANVNTGQLFHTGSNYSGNTTNGYIMFDVLNPCVLKKVKVYTDTPGNRIIELRNYSGVLLQSTSVNIPVDTSIVTLNFNLTAGIAYQLGTNSAQNTSTFGYISPRLKRSDAGVTFPYNINNFLTINNSSAGTGYYYYFYEWQVEEPATVCISTRTQVHVAISNGISALTNENLIKVFPNPSMGSLNISFEEKLEGATTIELTDIAGRLLKSNVYANILSGQTIKSNVSNIAPGTYLLNIKNENGSLTKSVTIMQ